MTNGAVYERCIIDWEAFNKILHTFLSRYIFHFKKHFLLNNVGNLIKSNGFWNNETFTRVKPRSKLNYYLFLKIAWFYAVFDVLQRLL